MVDHTGGGAPREAQRLKGEWFLPYGGRPSEGRGRDWRRNLALRLTDRVVHDRTGLTPLSVSADRIGHAALRLAALLARLARAGRPVDRSGTGVVVEVYPAASLRLWGLPHRRPEDGRARDREVRGMDRAPDRPAGRSPAGSVTIAEGENNRTASTVSWRYFSVCTC
ncbi:DUF429 domain-containing protein [Actinoallomurus sp. CA-150999]|uniref:DUF429 domain-containing protein n=1 Tax=Actinoallomurus sp. CA-150999 TaxID=3239887 RepID=UPI003D8C5E23